LPEGALTTISRNYISADPLSDITEAERAKFVMKGGVVVKNDFREQRIGNSKQGPDSEQRKQRGA
jgi:hypothetical protein